MKIRLNESVNTLSQEQAINIILDSIPNLKSFDKIKENVIAVQEAKKKDIGFWLFVEYFMKQRNPMGEAMSINYIGNENVIASWEIRTPENNDLDIFWVIDVQSKQKGGFTEIMNHIIQYCESNNLQYIGLQSYNDDVKSMYVNKFGFKEIDWFLLKDLNDKKMEESVNKKRITITESQLKFLLEYASPEAQAFWEQIMPQFIKKLRLGQGIQHEGRFFVGCSVDGKKYSISTNKEGTGLHCEYSPVCKSVYLNNRQTTAIKRTLERFYGVRYPQPEDYIFPLK